MRKKIYIMVALFLLFSFARSHQVFAKYVLQDTLKISVYIDNTKPIIHVTDEGKTENYKQTQTEIIKKKDEVVIQTSDNIAIAYNELRYHPSTSDFEEAETQKFENGQKLTEEGYYEIIAVDTSGNQTRIVILLDKSEPNILVQYFKKGEACITKQIAGTRKYMTAENIVDTEKKEIEKIDESENTEEIQENINEVTEQNMVEVEELDKPKEENEQLEEIIEEEIETDDVEEIKEVQEEIPNQTNEEIEETVQIVESKEEIEISEIVENEIMVMAAGEMYVGNEAEFRNALAMQASVIHVRQSIDFTAPIYINYAVTIMNAGTSNSLRYGNGGSFIVVQNGGSLTLSGIVVDTNSSGIGGMIGIDIQAGGYVTFTNSSIVDGGFGNIGILIQGGGSLLLWSSEIVRCSHGINLQANGNLYFATQEGRCNNFYWNATALFIDNFFGTCNINQNVCMHDNSEYGIYIGGSGGSINISAGTYYNNLFGVRTCNITSGNVTISDGSYYSNGWAIRVGGTLNLVGGTIYNNDYGVFTEEGYFGNFQMIGGSIYSNTSYAIYHTKTNDGGCTITGGNISGIVYLAANDNYINTNASYPSFTVTPSSYYFKRKLVKTANNSVANSEISQITLTPKDTWYKYVDNEYIVLWSGGNVIIRCKDYYGNILKEEIINGNIGESYSITAPTILGYDLNVIPSNSNGIYTQNDIVVEFQYDLVNVAKVTFEDLLSGVASAKYWYNSSSENFIGDGTDFANETVFENYGYYKVIVTNGVGLEREVKFVLNKNSLTR